MASTQGKRAKATKKTSAPAQTNNFEISKKTKKKILKSPILIAFIALFIAGVAIGFFVTDKNIDFSPLMMKVNGEQTEENDYAEIDLSAIKEKIQATKTDGSPVTAEEIAAATDFYDAGVSAYFFGTSLSNKVVRKVFYREDISHDAKETEDIDFSVSGVYYIEYTCNHFAFGNKKIIKTIFISGVEIDG